MTVRELKAELERMPDNEQVYYTTSIELIGVRVGRVTVDPFGGGVLLIADALEEHHADEADRS
jgi:hypothetical protein